MSGRGGRGGRGRGREDDDDDRSGRYGEGRRGDRRGGGGSRSHRLFDYGELRLVVLALLAEQPRHGYDIIKEIEDRTGGAYVPSPGVMYPTLAMLEELGQATLTESGGRKLYGITPDGETYIALNRTARDAAFAQMQAVRASSTGVNTPKIARATEHLQSSLRLLGTKGPLTDEQVDAVSDILEMAALAIERI